MAFFLSVASVSWIARFGLRWFTHRLLSSTAIIICVFFVYYVRKKFPCLPGGLSCTESPSVPQLQQNFRTVKDFNYFRFLRNLAWNKGKEDVEGRQRWKQVESLGIEDDNCICLKWWFFIINTIQTKTRKKESIGEDTERVKIYYQFLGSSFTCQLSPVDLYLFGRLCALERRISLELILRSVYLAFFPVFILLVLYDNLCFMWNSRSIFGLISKSLSCPVVASF